MIRTRLTSFVLLAIASAQPAAAQIASGGSSNLFRSDAAGIRVEPQYDVPQLYLGPLQANIALTVRTVIDNNIFRTANDRVDDVYFELAPSLRLLASLGPHSATFAARVALKRYAKSVQENNETVDLSYGGRVDLGEASSVTWNTGFARETESRGTAGTNLVSADPAEFQTLQSNWGATTNLGRIGIGVNGSIVQRTYLPLRRTAGGIVDQSFRDTRSLRIAPRASFGVAGSAAVFVAGSALRTTSLNRQIGDLRDANGYTLLAGFRTETDGLVVGEIGIGWRGQNYRNPKFLDFNGFTYDATVDWYPTRLFSLRVQAGQDIVNSGIPTVAGILRRTLAARAYYDPLRNLRLSLALDRDLDSFRELRFSTKTATTSLTSRFQLTRHFDISAYARFQSKSTSNARRLEGYDSFAVGVAFTGVL
jgi:hypothetical protein